MKPLPRILTATLTSLVSLSLIVGSTEAVSRDEVELPVTIRIRTSWKGMRHSRDESRQSTGLASFNIYGTIKKEGDNNYVPKGLAVKYEYSEEWKETDPRSEKCYGTLAIDQASGIMQLKKGEDVKDVSKEGHFLGKRGTETDIGMLSWKPTQQKTFSILTAVPFQFSKKRIYYNPAPACDQSPDPDFNPFLLVLIFQGLWEEIGRLKVYNWQVIVDSEESTRYAPNPSTVTGIKIEDCCGEVLTVFHNVELHPEREGEGIGYWGVFEGHMSLQIGKASN